MVITLVLKHLDLSASTLHRHVVLLHRPAHSQENRQRERNRSQSKKNNVDESIPGKGADTLVPLL